MVFLSRLPLFLAAIGLAGLLAVPVCHAIDLRDIEAAEVELEKLCEAWRQEYKNNPLDETARELGASLLALGMIERQAGKPEEAVEHLEEAATLLGGSDPSLATDAREAMALALQDMGRLPDAEKVLREVVAARRSAPRQATDPYLAASLDHLALNQLYQARYDHVRPLLDEALALAPPDDITFQASVLSHLGRLDHTLGSHVRAIRTFKLALALPLTDAELELSLQSQLALAQLRAGRIEQAREGMEAAARRARELFADGPMLRVPYLNNLGALELHEGYPEVAQAVFFKALEFSEESLGPDHPGLIQPLNNLGVAEQALQNYPAAREYFERAAVLQAAHLPPVHLRVAETARNLARNALLADDPDASLRVAAATDIGLRQLDQLIEQGSEKERLNFLERFDLVSLPCAAGDAGLIADTLLRSKGRLLDTMIGGDRSSASFRWQDIQAGLPENSAFIDACRYRTLGPESEPAYGAIVIIPGGVPVFIELGTEAELVGWLKAFRTRLDWRAGGSQDPPPPLTMRGVLRALERFFWEPLADVLPPGTEAVAVSPDGALHFLPLPVLLDAHNTPLSQRLRLLTTVSSGRDLLVTAPPSSLADQPWTVMTISDFPGADTPPASGGPALARLLSALEAMPGTLDEADKLKRIAPSGSTFLHGERAAEENLRNLQNSPGLLHLGCHSFFLSQGAPVQGMAIDFHGRHELLFSGGLVLYDGVNHGTSTDFVAGGSPDDDLLFPSEIASLPLGDTRLVTLSSCESGVGTPVNGEGLLGLRRGFSLAGAREIVVALWPVSDRSTPDFMERFYRLALASGRPAQALWQTQAEFLGAASTDEQAFELAVLRYAPFTLSQTGPLVVGGEIEAAAPRRWWLWLAAVPLAAFLLGRRSLLKRLPRA